jgi:glycosyltransferase involved in cell wall biosynthesis
MRADENTELESDLPLAVHLVPFDGIGGVEVAARTTPDATLAQFRFRKLYLLDGAYCAANTQTAATNPSRKILDHPRVYWCALQRLRILRPRLVIASLWRSCAVAIALKLVRPSTKVVTFLHLATDVHLADKWLNTIAMWLSTEIWADSQATLDARVLQRFRGRTRVISFLVERQLPTAPRAPLPRFVFWGRLHQQKNLIRALRLFSLIRARQTDAEFLLVGPDGGQRAHLEQQVAALGLSDAVRFTGAIERELIFALSREFSFYLQTSEVEGMAMSVIEAMQLGLVPVVTPVGEIKHYCQDGVNAVFVSQDEAAASQTIALIGNAARFRQMANAAAQTWQTKRLYREDLMDACGQLLNE